MAKTIPQKLFSHGGVYVLVRLADRATGFVLMPIYAVYLGEEGYGALALITTTASIVLTVLLQGQVGAWGRLRYGLNDADRQKLETSIFWYANICSGLGIALLGLFGEGLSRLVMPGIDFGLVRLGLVAGALTVPMMFYNRTLQEAQRPRGFLVLNTASTVLKTSLIVTLVAGLELGVAGVLLAQMTAGLMVFSGATYFLKPSWPWRGKRALVAQSAKFGLPIVGHAMAGQVNNFADRIMVNYILGAGATGNYAMGYKLASLLSMAGTSLNQAFNPLLNRGLTDAKTADVDERLKIEQSIRRAALYQIAMVAIFGLAITTPARELIELMTGGRFAQAWQVVPLVVAGTLIVAVYQPFACSLIYHKRTKQLPIVSTTGAVVNLALNWLLIPVIGILGAAVATFASSLIFMTLIWRMTRTLFQPLIGARWLLLIAIALSSLAVLAYLDWSLDSLWLRAPCKLAVGAAGVSAILGLSGARPRDLKALLNRRKRAAVTE